MQELRQHHVFWQRLDSPGLEHLLLDFRPRELGAYGLVIGASEETGEPFRVQYSILADLSGAVIEVSVTDILKIGRSIALKSNGLGRWQDSSGAALPELDGCIDVDLTITPSTNTLPIRRLGLRLGESQAIDAAYIQLPEFKIMRTQQRYTYVAQESNFSRWLFQQGNFEAGLSVDADGLVLDYAGLFQRIWAG